MFSSLIISIKWNRPPRFHYYCIVLQQHVERLPPKSMASHQSRRMNYIINPDIATKLEEQLVIGENITRGMNMFRKPPTPSDTCHICLDPLPYIVNDQIICVICGFRTCRKCKKKDIKINMRWYCDICKRGLKNHAKERKHIEDRINKGDYLHCILLGDYHRRGEAGYEGGVGASLYYYHLAAEHGVALGYKLIGDAYGYGARNHGVKKDLAKCVRFLRVAAKMGCVEAHQKLIELCKRDSPQVALRHAAVLARVGNEEAFTYIMDCLRAGIFDRNDEFDDVVREFRENRR